MKYDQLYLEALKLLSNNIFPFSFIYIECSFFQTCDTLTFGDYMSKPEIYWLFIACLFHTIIWFVGLKVADVIKDGGSPLAAFECISTVNIRGYTGLN